MNEFTPVNTPVKGNIEFISSALALVILEAVVAVVKREQQPVEQLLRTAVRWQVELVRARVDLGQDAGLHVVVAQPGRAYCAF